MNQIDVLILELLDCRTKKMKAIGKQNFIQAAKYRDKEKDISRKIFTLLPSPENGFDAKDFQQKLDKYCKDVYGVGFFVNDSLKQLRRSIKIKNLGI
jgi:hypothetical protein